MLPVLAWMDLYRQSRRQSRNNSVDITAPTGDALPSTRPDAAIDAVLELHTEKPHEADRLAFTLGEQHAGESLLTAAQWPLVIKPSGDPHTIEFPVAIFEDLRLVNATW